MSTTDVTASQLPTDTYWAAAERERLADTIRAKALAFRKRLEDDGRIELWRRAERTYYGQDPEGGMANSAAVTFGGDEGEKVMLRHNHYRSIVQGLLAIAAPDRPAFEARARSTDNEAMGQARLATALIDAYFRDKGLETTQRDVARMGVVLAEGFTVLRWATWKGAVLTQKQRPVYDDNGQPTVEMVEQERPANDFTTEIATELVEQPVTEPWDVHEGDAEAQAFHPIEVVRDLDAPNRDLTWCLLPYRENVWELAARYPERRKEIVALRGSQRWPRTAWGQQWDTPRPDEDAITVWYLYHLPSDALPKGRHAIVAGDVVVYDDAMPLGEIPVYACIPEMEMGTASGYSAQTDLLAPQQALDAMYDVIHSSHSAFGTQNIIAPDGTKVSPEDVGRGMRLWEYTPNPDVPNNGKPEALQLLAISPDSYKLTEIEQQQMETLSGLNSTARGQPMPQLKSGTALALVQSLAVSFNSALQGEIVRHNERVATGLLKMLQLFAKNERTTAIAGKTKRAAVEKWSADAIKEVTRITVDIASPLMQSTAGRLQAAQDLLAQGLITTPAQYFEVLASGALEPMYESPLSRVTYIRDENEMMMDGTVPQVSLFDDHGAHVAEHLGCLDSDEVRTTPALFKIVNDHVMMHLQAWSTMDPALALLTKQSIMPLPPAMPMAPPGPGGAPSGPPPKGGPPEQKAQPLGQNGGPGMPSMPQPATPPPGAPAPIA